MLLYVNGCSHSVGHAIVNVNCGMAKDDSKYWHLGESPHPDNFPYSYGYLLAKKHNLSLVAQGLSGGSIDRVIRTTKQFLGQYVGDICLLIGWPGFDREEWKYNDAYYQINASGNDNLPDGLKQRYKEWVAHSTVNKNSVARSYQKINQFHFYLKKQCIKHLFFNTAGDFSSILESNRTNFGNNYLLPYQWNHEYLGIIQNKGFKARDDWYHYGADAHQFWADYLEPYLLKVLDGS
jgi:hypothetical protein